MAEIVGSGLSLFIELSWVFCNQCNYEQTGPHPVTWNGESRDVGEIPGVKRRTSLSSVATCSKLGAGRSGP